VRPLRASSAIARGPTPGPAEQDDARVALVRDQGTGAEAEADRAHGTERCRIKHLQLVFPQDDEDAPEHAVDANRRRRRAQGQSAYLTPAAGVDDAQAVAHAP